MGLLIVLLTKTNQMNKFMKPLTLIIAAAIFFPFLIQAQDPEPAIEAGDQFFNFGFGLGSVRFSGTGYTSTIPPLSVSYEKIIMDGVLERGFIGIGAYLGFSSYKWTTPFLGEEWGWRYTTIVPGARGSFHYPLLNNVDTYTGLMLGYEIVSASEVGDIGGGSFSAVGSRIALAWYAGGRYFLSDNFSIMAELGYGITYLNLGVALRL
jgi:hypothetical protein